MRQCYKVKRGMIFWYDPQIPQATKTSVQKGRRPYVVISNDKGNLTAPTCNICPCTTETKTGLPVHVNVMFNNQHNTILLEQSRTVDQNELKEYIGMLTDESIEKIDEAIRIQYDVKPKYSGIELDSVMSKLEDIVGDIIRSKVEENTALIPESEIENSALRLGQMLEDLVLGSSKKDVCESSPTSVQSSEIQDSKSYVSDEDNDEDNDEDTTENRKLDSHKLSKPVKVSNAIKKTRIKWTNDLRRQYLKDCDEMSPNEVMKKWNFSSVGTVFSTKYNCRNILNNLNVVEE